MNGIMLAGLLGMILGYLLALVVDAFRGLFRKVDSLGMTHDFD